MRVNIELVKICLCIFLYSTVVNAGPPYFTEDPYPAPYQNLQMYLFTEMDKTNLYRAMVLPGLELNYGVLSNLEINCTFGFIDLNTYGQLALDNYGMGDMQIGLKYAFVTEGATNPQVAFAPVYYIPTGNYERGLGNGRSWALLPIWLGKTWSQWSTYGGFGYGLNGAPVAKNFFYGGAVMQRQINNKLSLGAELFSQTSTRIGSAPFTILNLGCNYNLYPKMQILFSLGHTIFGDQHLVSYFALYWLL